MYCNSFTRQQKHKQPSTSVSPHWDLMDRMRRSGPDLIKDLNASLDRQRKMKGVCQKRAARSVEAHLISLWEMC